jgi:hypothetical protein
MDMGRDQEHGPSRKEKSAGQESPELIRGGGGEEDVKGGLA